MLIKLSNFKRRVNYTFGLDGLGRWDRGGTIYINDSTKSNPQKYNKIEVSPNMGSPNKCGLIPF